MSRRSSSSKHKSSSSSSSSRHKGMEADSEAILESVKRILSQIDSVVSESPDDWQAYLGRARSAISSLDRIHFFCSSSRLAEQEWIIRVMQAYAFHDADEGNITEIVEWCQTTWLRILRDHPNDVDILAGLGSNWLQKSQEILARIHQDEVSASSSAGSNESISQVSTRINGPLYVEARGSLQPAVDFYYRAVRAADSNGELTGDLLTSAAEAYMSLGNVCNSSVGEQHFSRAIHFLRRAKQIPDYELSDCLEQYIEDYGRFVR